MQGRVSLRDRSSTLIWVIVRVNGGICEQAAVSYLPMPITPRYDYVIVDWNQGVENTSYVRLGMIAGVLVPVEVLGPRIGYNNEQINKQTSE